MAAIIITPSIMLAFTKVGLGTRALHVIKENVTLALAKSCSRESL
jgi:hypothetical protein